ncbi:MAG: hypothetical protein IPP74_12605 [Alphaproteobacteria bacterium]|nr:hypothetical protein [Alphaproteobacteria bacterium]
MKNDRENDTSSLHSIKYTPIDRAIFGYNSLSKIRRSEFYTSDYLKGIINSEAEATKLVNKTTSGLLLLERYIAFLCKGNKIKNVHFGDSI